jgi:hypothetical protein
MTISIDQLKISYKNPCRFATTANINLATTALTVIDGVTPVAGDRAFVKDQSAGEENGIYVVSAGAWTRALDFNSTADNGIQAGLVVRIQEGTANAGREFKLDTTGLIVLDTTVLVFTNSSTNNSHAGFSDLDWTTGLHTGGANQLAYFDGTGAAADSSNLIYDGTDVTMVGGGLKIDNDQKISWYNAGAEKAYILGSPATSTGSLDLNADTSVRINPGNVSRAYFQTGGGIQITEAATGTPAIVGRGTYWVKNETPNTAMFIDDVGNSIAIAGINTGNPTVRNTCNAATTANIVDLAAGAPDPVDGFSLTVGDYVLVKDQSTGSENGVYVVDTVGTGADGAWTRALFWNDAIKDRIEFGVTHIITGGTVNGGSAFTLVTSGTIVIDTTALTFITVFITSGGDLGSVDNKLIRTHGIMGGKIQDTGIVIDDADNVSDVKSLIILESGSIPIATAAGEGAIWVKDDAPSSLMFTDDAGTDHQLVYTADVTAVSTYKDPCRVATNTDITLVGSAPDTVDGIALAADDRILVAGQTAGAENGIYYVSTLGTGANGTWTRGEDFNDVTTDNIQAGVVSYIQEGDHAKTRYTLITTGTIILDTTTLEFFEEAAMARSDATSTDLNNLGTNATPVALTTAYRVQGDLTDVRDFSKAIWYVYVAAIGTATSVTIRVEWYDDGGTYPSRQGTEAITAGAAVLSEYEATFSLGGSGSVPPIPLEVLGPNVRLSVKADIGTTTTVHSRIWRKA